MSKDVQLQVSYDPAIFQTPAASKLYSRLIDPELNVDLGTSKGNGYQQGDAQITKEVRTFLVELFAACRLGAEVTIIPPASTASAAPEVQA